MEYSQVSMEPSWHMDRQEQVKIEQLVYSDPEVTRESSEECLHYCASCCQYRSLSLSFFDRPARPTILVADTKHTVYQSQRWIFSMTHNLQH